MNTAKDIESLMFSARIVATKKMLDKAIKHANRASIMIDVANPQSALYDGSGLDALQLEITIQNALRKLSDAEIILTESKSEVRLLDKDGSIKTVSVEEAVKLMNETNK